ncbi:MAG: FAD-dependent oxidoreductase [Thermoflexus sp.]|nr:FAD-dependent oxidoreductase [Thermoflexus sp.]
MYPAPEFLMHANLPPEDLRLGKGEKGQLAAIEFVGMTLGQPDASGRRRPVPIPGSNFILPVDTAVLAPGFWPDPTVAQTTSGLQVSRSGLIATGEAGRTSRLGVFAAGDGVTGPDRMATASAAAMRAAQAVHEYLMTPPLEEAPEALPVAEPAWA